MSSLSSSSSPPLRDRFVTCNSYLPSHSHSPSDSNSNSTVTAVAASASSSVGSTSIHIHSPPSTHSSIHSHSHAVVHPHSHSVPVPSSHTSIPPPPLSSPPRPYNSTSAFCIRRPIRYLRVTLRPFCTSTFIVLIFLFFLLLIFLFFSLRSSCNMDTHLHPILSYTSSQLESHSIPFWLDSGTLLGIVRDGHIIPYDFDLDLGVMEEECAKISQLKDTFLIEKGYHLYTNEDSIAAKKSYWLNSDAYLHGPCVRIYDRSHSYFLDIYWYRRLTKQQFDQIKQKNPALVSTDGLEKEENREEERSGDTKPFQTMAIGTEQIPFTLLGPELTSFSPVPVVGEEEGVAANQPVSIPVSIPSPALSPPSTPATIIEVGSVEDAASNSGLSVSNEDWICNFRAFEPNQAGGCRPFYTTFPLSSFPFDSTSLPVPASSATHLDLIYGRSWRTPIPRGYKRFLCTWLPSKVVLIQVIVLVLCALIGVGVREWRRKTRGEQRKREDGAQASMELERIMEGAEEEGEETEDEERRIRRLQDQEEEKGKVLHFGETDPFGETDANV